MTRSVLPALASACPARDQRPDSPDAYRSVWVVSRGAGYTVGKAADSYCSRLFPGGAGLALAMLLIMLLGCGDHQPPEAGADPAGHSAPSSATVAANRAVQENLPKDDRSAFEDATRGLIATPQSLRIESADGQLVWDMGAYAFVRPDGKETPAPASVHPALWRQASLNGLHGLFRVTEGIHQVRGFDLANMTLIEGRSGWIIVDPLTTAETARAAFQFAQQHLGHKPVRAVLITHSHIDHFGGIEGIVEDLPDAERDALRIIAPEGFLEEATSENVIAGTAMSRRAMYMYGRRLERGERGHIDSGLGKEPAFGRFGIRAPTEVIGQTPTRLEIDGLEFIFQNAPGSEAPAEFTFYLPALKAFCGAEVVSHTLHNLYTLRGAKVRDAQAWSAYIEEARNLFGEAEVYFGGHHWPVWGRERIQAFLSGQRDLYKYIHDQSVRLLNAGLTPDEIAEELELPPALQASFSNRGYYGTVKHNARAVYQAYLGWFTGNPARLDPLPDVETARRQIALMGGVERVVAEAERLFDEASSAPPAEVGTSYRWIAQLLDQAVMADPGHAQAKALLARAYDQLGYLAESAPWRDFYLTGAYELRHGPPQQGIAPSVMREILLKTPVERLFDSMAVNLDGPAAQEKRLSVKIHFTDRDSNHLLRLENAVLRHGPATAETPADATLHLPHALFVALLVGEAGVKETLFGDQLDIEGSRLDLVSFLALFDKPKGTFNIVVP